MKRHLKQFVKCELFPGQTPPPITNRRFYPTDVDVRNHMYRASVKKLLSKVDQENLSYCRNRKWNRWDLWADWRTPLCTSNSLAETSYESLWKYPSLMQPFTVHTISSISVLMVITSSFSVRHICFYEWEPDHCAEDSRRRSYDVTSVSQMETSDDRVRNCAVASLLDS